MFKKTDKQFAYETELSLQRSCISPLAPLPETAALCPVTKCKAPNLEVLHSGSEGKDYCYQHRRNFNLKVLNELITSLEGGVDSIVCSSGMAAISTAIMSIVKTGDHILSDLILYGDTMNMFNKVLRGYGIYVTYADFTDLAAVQSAMRSNTKILYTETISTPLISVVDVTALAEIAHSVGSTLIVDNTVTTALSFKPLEHGADIVINSFTAISSGHSDATCGAITGNADLVQKAYQHQLLIGSSADAYIAWLVQQGLSTMALRVEKQMANAQKLANALSASPYVLKVNYPSLESHPQNEFAKQMFKNGYGSILSFLLPDDPDKLNQFLRKFPIAQSPVSEDCYRTTLSHLSVLSHQDMLEDNRGKLGSNTSLLKVSVGIENTNDLLEHFLQALEVYNTCDQ